MRPFMQSLLAFALAGGLFASGVFVGRSLGAHPAVAIPSQLEVLHRGIPNEKVECLQWVDSHYENPKAGLISLLCNGSTGVGN